jgi:hypothetical protein
MLKTTLVHTLRVVMHLMFATCIELKNHLKADTLIHMEKSLVVNIVMEDMEDEFVIGLSVK